MLSKGKYFRIDTQNPVIGRKCYLLNQSACAVFLLPMDMLSVNEKSNEMTEQPKQINQPNWKKRTIILASIMVVAVFVCYVYFFYFSEENKARKVVEAHLETIKTGVGNPYDTVDIGSVSEVFINVLDYKYLTTAKADKVPDSPIVFDRKMYDSIYKDIYKSYDEYLNRMAETYGDKAKREGDKIIVTRDTSHYEFAFLYDLVLTNGLGQQIYKKYTFVVKPSSIGKYSYKITALYDK